MGHRETYEKFVKTIEDTVRGSRPDDLERRTQNAYIAITQGYVGNGTSELPYANQIIDSFNKYGQLKNNRRKIKVAGVEREMAPETEILEGLEAVRDITGSLIVPYFSREVDLVNTVISETLNLSLGYANSITQSAAEEYVPLESRQSAKLNATDIARNAMSIQLAAYDDENHLSVLSKNFGKFCKSLDLVEQDYLRPFEMNFTKPKNITHKAEDIRKVAERVVNSGYRPEFIFPIAHGGLETGLVIDLCLRKEGCDQITYPLLFSIKTRRHSKPQLKGDEKILGNIAESDVLLTEDWVTTGNTVRGIIGELEMSYFPHDIRVATIKQDPKSFRNPMLTRFDLIAGHVSEYKGTKNDRVLP